MRGQARWKGPKAECMTTRERRLSFALSSVVCCVWRGTAACNYAHVCAFVCVNTVTVYIKDYAVLWCSYNESACILPPLLVGVTRLAQAGMGGSASLSPPPLDHGVLKTFGDEIVCTDWSRYCLESP